MGKSENNNSPKCLCELTKILFFACSGGSNVGQIANEAAKSLDTLGRGKMYSLAGIGGNVSGIVESTKAAGTIVALDGCALKCAKKTLEKAGFSVDVHVVATDLNISKRNDFFLDLEDIDKVVEEVNSRRSCVIRNIPGDVDK